MFFGTGLEGGTESACAGISVLPFSSAFHIPTLHYYYCCYYYGANCLALSFDYSIDSSSIAL